METTLYRHRRALPPREEQQDGVYVIADAYRFTTTVTHLLDKGAASVRPFFPEETEAIKRFKQNHSDALVRQPKPNKNIGVYNSATYADNFDVEGRPIGLHSTNGSKAVRQVDEAHPLYVVSTINAAAVATVLKERHPNATVHLVASGDKRGRETVEDLVATGLLQAALDGTVSSVEEHYDAMLSAARDSYQTNKSDAARQDYERLREFNTIQTVPKRNDVGSLVAVTPREE